MSEEDTLRNNSIAAYNQCWDDAARKARSDKPDTPVVEQELVDRLNRLISHAEANGHNRIQLSIQDVKALQSPVQETTRIWINKGKSGCPHEWEIEEGSYCCAHSDCDAEYTEHPQGVVINPEIRDLLEKCRFIECINDEYLRDIRDSAVALLGDK